MNAPRPPPPLRMMGSLLRVAGVGLLLSLATPARTSAAQPTASGGVSVQLDRGAIKSITVTPPSSSESAAPVVFEMLPGAGTALEGCAAVPGSEQLQQIAGGGQQVHRTMHCGPSEYHNLTSATATVIDTFTPSAAGGTVRWTVNITSSSAQAWSTGIVAALGYADWAATSSQLFLGGPRSAAAPSLKYDPFALFSLPPSKPPLSLAGSSTNNGSWFVAKGYDATYDCQTGPCVKSTPATTADYSGCEALCAAAAKTCKVWAWSERSHDCWFRTDAQWGAKSTLHPYRAVSGCKQGADPVTGNPYVAGCGKMPPIGPPGPPPPGQAPARYYYGGQDNNIGRPEMAEDTAVVLPMLTRVAGSIGLTLAQDPNDTPIVAYATAAAAAAGGAAWLNWTRVFHRLGGNADPISFSADFIATGPDWKPAAAWMARQYPTFFEPNPAALETARRVSGTGSYADLRGADDFEPSAAQLYADFGWAMNWDSTARFPWHGEWMPTAEDGFGEQWVSCFAHGPPDGHTHEGCKNVSYAEIDSWYRHINKMGLAVDRNFSSCQYGNLFEFGWNVEKAYPDKTVNCTAAATSGNPEQQLLCHTQQLLEESYGKALLFTPTDPDPKTGKLVCGGLDGSCVMDPHPDLPYLQHGESRGNFIHQSALLHYCTGDW